MGGHREADNPFGTQGVYRQRGNQCRINAAAEGHDNPVEAIFVHIVAQARDQRSIDLFEIAQRLLG